MLKFQMVCADCLIPEFWFENPERVGALTRFSSPRLRRPIPTSHSKPTFIVAGASYRE